MLESHQSLRNRISHCTVCKDHLPNAPKPILQIHPTARILIAGQAPGIKAHASGKPFDDASGVRLRQWLKMDEKAFYDPKKVAILPMAFCYPGKGKSGDLPPLHACAETWRERVMNQLPNITLTIIIGQYAYAHYYPKNTQNLTDAVKSWQQYLPNRVVLPHPSPRNNIWLKRHPWFEHETVPAIQKLVSGLI